MAMKLHLGDFPATGVTFGYSVLHELLLSLLVLDNIKEHPLHITWALDVIKQLPDDFHVERRYFRALIRGGLWLIWKADSVETPSFELELADFKRESSEDFASAIITIAVNAEVPGGKRVYSKMCHLEEFRESEAQQNRARQWLQTYYPESEAIITDILSDSHRVKQRFVDLIERYWQLIFCDFWTEWESYFLNEIHRRGQNLYRHGILSALEKLTPRTYIDYEAQSVTFVSNTGGEELHFNPDNTIHLVPSYFLYPGTVFRIITRDEDKDITLSITYPIPEIQQEARSPMPPENLLRMLRGPGDATRLQILQLLAQKERSTGEIAKIIGLSDAAISKHLKILQDGGWVTGKRSSYYVLYQANRDALENMTSGLRNLLNF